MRPSDARRVLRKLWSTIDVQSCADGTLRISPKWRRQWRRHGVLTRMYSARMVKEVLGVGSEK